MSIALLLSALVYAAVLLKLLSLNGARASAVVLIAALALAFVPYPWGPVAWLASYSGELSLTTVVLAASGLAVRAGWYAGPSRSELRGLCVLLAVTGALLYPLTLGVGRLNPYAWGFGSYPMSTALLLLGLGFWLLRWWHALAALVLAQFAAGRGLLASDNLWDYLLDLWLVLWAVGWLVADGLRGLRARYASE
jgi:hypothetical protein